MLEQDPCLWEAWLSPTPPRRPLSLNIFLALCAPLSFSVTPDAVISGSDVRACAEARGAAPPGVGKAGWRR